MAIERYEHSFDVCSLLSLVYSMNLDSRSLRKLFLCTNTLCVKSRI